MLRALCLIALFTVNACGAVTNGGKPGAISASDPAYRECREFAGETVETQANIDQDIAATRQSDVQRSSVVRSDTQLMRDRTRDRQAAIIDACLRAKGTQQPQ